MLPIYPMIDTFGAEFLRRKKRYGSGFPVCEGPSPKRSPILERNCNRIGGIDQRPVGEIVDNSR